MKLKMFGFVRTWFARPAEQQTEPVALQHETAPVPTPPAPVMPVKPVQCSSDATALDLPLTSLLGQIPPELQGRLRGDPAHFMVRLPVEAVLPQLAHGSVKMTFGELRQAVPGAFLPENDRDHLAIHLPLAEILMRMNPAMLARRPAQRRFEVPEEISGPFADHGQGLILSPKPANPEPAPFQPAPRATRPAPAAVPVARPTREVIRVVPPPSETGAPPAYRFATHPPVSPASQPPAIRSVQPTPLTPSLKPGGNGGGNRLAAGPSHVPLRPSVPAAVVPTASPKTPSNGATLMVPLVDLSETWPDALRHEMVVLNLSKSIVALPLEFVEAGLKQGQISCSWKQMRAWIKPEPANATVSIHDTVTLNLPLKIVAPLFLAKQRAGKAQPKVTIDQSIPDLFFGAAQPDLPATLVAPVAPVARIVPETPITPAAPITPVAPIAPVAAEPPAPVATPGSQRPKPADTNFYVWKDDVDAPVEPEPVFKRGATSPGTEFLKRYSTPNEIISRAAALEGVAGSLISLPDGLLVASRIPPELNADTLAAFLPHIFGRVSQCTKELRMGELNNLNFTVGNVPWKIFKVGAIFFAAFGRMGEAMPTAQLAGLAAELDRRPK